jgi:hypothetical protein
MKKCFDSPLQRFAQFLVSSTCGDFLLAVVAHAQKTGFHA